MRIAGLNSVSCHSVIKHNLPRPAVPGIIQLPEDGSPVPFLGSAYFVEFHCLGCLLASEFVVRIVEIFSWCVMVAAFVHPVAFADSICNGGMCPRKDISHKCFMMTARTFISGFYYVAGFQLVFVTISKIDFIVNGVNTVKGVYKVYTVYTFLLLLMILATEVWLMPISHAISR